jgi:hypothetical protein
LCRCGQTDSLHPTRCSSLFHRLCPHCQFRRRCRLLMIGRLGVVSIRHRCSSRSSVRHLRWLGRPIPRRGQEGPRHPVRRGTARDCSRSSLLSRQQRKRWGQGSRSSPRKRAQHADPRSLKAILRLGRLGSQELCPATLRDRWQSCAKSPSSFLGGNPERLAAARFSGMSQQRLACHGPFVEGVAIVWPCRRRWLQQWEYGRRLSIHLPSYSLNRETCSKKYGLRAATFACGHSLVVSETCNSEVKFDFLRD